MSFSEALWAETRGRGLRVLALCPGPTDTGFFGHLANPAAGQAAIYARLAPVERVVEVGLRAFEAGRATPWWGT